MSKENRKVIEPVREDQSKGAMHAAKEGLKAIVPGLTLNNILFDIGSEIKQMGAHGAHEMAAALFNGSGFVMYPRSGGQQKEDPQHGLPEDAIKPPGIQKERGGMEM
jgi:hypothetical protein